MYVSTRYPQPRYLDASGEPSQRPARLDTFTARTALSRVYGATTQGFPASLSLAALDLDQHREGALEILKALVELNERHGRIAPGRLPQFLAAIGEECR